MKEKKSKIKDKPSVKNKCKICNWFEERADNEEYKEIGGFFSSKDVQYLNTLLKQTDINTKNMLAINKAFNDKAKCTFKDYAYKQHKIHCLINFQVPEQSKTINEPLTVKKDNKKSESLKTEYIELDKEKFKSVPYTEQDLIDKKKLRWLYSAKIDCYYNEGVQSFNKDEVSILKNLNDLISSNNIDVSNIDFSNLDDGMGRNDLEKIGVKFIQLITEKGIINQDIGINISKLFIKSSGDLEFLKSTIKSMTDEEKLKLVEKMIEQSNETNFK
jgi:hypothetical protein